MRAILVPQSGGPEALILGEAPIPSLQPGEVLIRVAAAGVNRADILQRQGHYPPPPGASAILGLEVAGHIASIAPGAESRWQIGDPVCALLAGGGYAEFCAVPSAQCLPIPAGLSPAHAAILPEACFTVWANLLDTAHLHPGDTLLVQGGSSGIGSMAIQIAKALGATVLTTAGSEEKCRFCLDLGADAAFNYRAPSWVEQARPYGINVVLDMIGGDYLPLHLDLLAPGGRLVHLAHSRSREATLDIALVMRKRLIVTGSTLRARPVPEKARLRNAIEQHLWPLFAAQRLRPVPSHTFPIEQAAEAHRLMESSRHTGKISLTLPS